MPESHESDPESVARQDNRMTDTYDPDAALESISKKERLAQATLDRLRHLSFDPANQKRFERTWTISQLETLLIAGISQRFKRQCSC